MYLPEDVAGVHMGYCLFPMHQVQGITSSPFILTYMHKLDIITSFFKYKKTEAQKG